ncbi:MAG: hypothetical protein HQK51_01725 [Oligoflexia bacterium]|nr:hypothetical protein [Oligoflexia bacterium]
MISEKNDILFILKNIPILFYISIFSITLSTVYAQNEQIIELSPDRINLACKDHQPQLLLDPKNDNKIIGNLKCVDDPKVGQQVSVFAESNSERIFSFEGEYLQTLILAVDSIKLKNIHSPHSLKIKSKKVFIEGTNIIPVDFEVDSPNFNIESGKTTSKNLIIVSNILKNNATIESSKIDIQSETITLNNNSVLDSSEGISIVGQNHLVVAGVIKSNGDISINANSAELKKDTRIFSNGVYRIAVKKELTDESKTIARMGSSFWAKTISFLTNFYFLGEVSSIVADNINIDQGANLSVSRILISTNNEKQAYVQLSGNIFISRDLGSMKGMKDKLKSLSNEGWFKYLQLQSQSSDNSDFQSIEGIQFISHKDLLTAKNSLVEGDRDILLKSKYLFIDGKISTTDNKGNIILQSQQAKLNAILSSSKAILIETTEKLESSAKMMALEYITLNAKNITISTPSILSAGTNINMTAIGGAITIAGVSDAKGSIDLLCDKRLVVSGEHTAGTEMHLTSREDKVVVNEGSILKYDTATFIGALGVENNGTRSGITETIDAPEIFERGKIKVETTTYKKGNIHFSAQLSESKLLKIENAGTVEFLNGADVKSGAIDIKSSKLTVSKDSKLESDEVLDLKSDFAKIEGALNSLGTLIFNGKEFHLEEGGVIIGKGDISLEGDLVEIKNKAQVESSSKIVITGNNEVNIDGTIKAGSSVGINAKKDLILANNSNIQGNFVAIDVGAKITSDGQITSDKNIEFKLANDNGNNIRGHLKADGWVVVSGKMNTESIVSLVTDRKDVIEAQGLNVITTEPIVIQKDIELKYGLALDASSITMDKDSSISASEISLNATEGDVTLESATKIIAKKNVNIHAKGDIVRKAEELSDKSVAISSIKSEKGDVFIISTDGSYIDTAAETKSAGNLVIKTKKGIVITPIKQVFVTQSIDKKWYGKKTTTTTSIMYTETHMDAKNLVMISDEGGGGIDITNLIFNGKKLTPESYDPEKIFLKCDKDKLSLKQIENSVSSIVDKSYNSFVKPFASTYEAAKDINEAGRKLTRDILKVGEKVLREVSKPIYKNISGSEKYIDLIINLADSGADFAWNVSNPEKFYHVDTYREQYNAIKNVAVQVIKDSTELEKKFANKLNEEVIDKISHDISHLVDETIKIQDKSVSYVDAATSFENVARVSLVTLASSLAGPSGSALANIIADKFISKKEMTSKQILESLAIGIAAGYAAEKATELAAKDFKNFFSTLTNNSVSTLSDRVFNDRSYSSSDAIAMILCAGASGANSSNYFVNGAISGGSNQIISGAVIDHRVDLSEAGDAAFRGGINDTVNSNVSESVNKYVYDSLPSEYRKRWDLYLAAEMTDRFKKAVTALSEALANEKKDNDSETPEGDKKSDDKKENVSSGKSSSETPKVTSTDPSNLLGEDKYLTMIDPRLGHDLNNYDKLPRLIRPEFLDDDGFYKDTKIKEEQKEVIKQEMRQLSPKASDDLKNEVNNWGELNSRQNKVLNYLDDFGDLYKKLNDIPMVTIDGQWARETTEYVLKSAFNELPSAAFLASSEENIRRFGQKINYLEELKTVASLSIEFGKTLIQEYSKTGIELAFVAYNTFPLPSDIGNALIHPINTAKKVAAAVSEIYGESVAASTEVGVAISQPITTTQKLSEYVGEYLLTKSNEFIFADNLERSRMAAKVTFDILTFVPIGGLGPLKLGSIRDITTPLLLDSQAIKNQVKAMDNIIGVVNNEMNNIGKITESAAKLKIKTKEGVDSFVDGVKRFLADETGSLNLGKIDDTGLVWNKIKNAAEDIPGSKIPRRFDIEVGGQSFHVHPNATKHMGEHISKNVTEEAVPVYCQLTLSSMEGALKKSVETGTWRKSIETGDVFTIEGWEFKFSQRPDDVLPVLMHAFKKRGK